MKLLGNDEKVSQMILTLPIGVFFGIWFIGGFWAALAVQVIGWFLRNLLTIRAAQRLGFDPSSPTYLDYMPSKTIKHVLYKAYIIAIVIVSITQVLFL